MKDCDNYLLFDRFSLIAVKEKWANKRVCIDT